MSRRDLLATGLAAGGLALGPRTAWAALGLSPTPRQTAGPFYPVRRPLDSDADLTRVTGRPGRAQGQLLHLMGRVVAGSGEPLPGVVVEIWQADAHGRYHHPEDGRRGPRDPHFQGFGSQRTDAQGRYRFKTIKPGAYPAAPGWIRPPHIHFQVTGNTERLVTQMYFPGEPLNDRDPILQASGAPAALVTTLSPPTPEMASDALIAVWDIVLASG